MLRSRDARSRDARAHTDKVTLTGKIDRGAIIWHEFASPVTVLVLTPAVCVERFGDDDWLGVDRMDGVERIMIDNGEPKLPLGTKVRVIGNHIGPHIGSGSDDTCPLTSLRYARAMKQTHRCPKCSGTRLYVCTNHQPDPESSNAINLFRVFTAHVPAADVGSKSGSDYRTHVGEYETWICAGCGFTEWYAQDPEHLLQKLASDPRSGVRVVDAEATSPFR